MFPFTQGQSGHMPLHKPWLCLPDFVPFVKDTSLFMLLTKLENVCLYATDMQILMATTDMSLVIP